MYDGIIIDAHVHPFIDPADNIARYGHPETIDDFAAELKKCGISKACGSVITHQRQVKDFEVIRKVNRDALEAQKRYPDLIVPGIHVHSDFPEESAEELRIMHDTYHVHWIGELVHYSMGTGLYDNEGMFKIYETAVALNMPVNIHCSDVNVVRNVVKNFPKLNVVLAHPEDLDTQIIRCGLVKEFKNLYLDISGTGIFRWGFLKYAVKTCGAEKILYGSDFPICSPGMNKGGALAEHLTQREFELVMAENFLRLTGEK